MAAERKLIILDLNGTILHRLTHEWECKAFRQHPIVLKNNLSTDVTVNGAKITFRPFSERFLGCLFRHFDVAVWTSCQPKNAFPIVYQSFKTFLDVGSLLKQSKSYDLSPSQVLLFQRFTESIDQLLEKTRDLHRLQFVWTQSECDTVFPETKEPVEKFIKPIRKKNLDKVWQAFPQYSKLNTLIIDDTEAKLVGHEDNHLQIPEFNTIQEDVDFTKDDVLLKLQHYMEALNNENPKDVRAYLSEHKFE